MKGLRLGFTEEDTDDTRVAFLKQRLDFDELLEDLGIETSHYIGDWLMCHCPKTVNHSSGDTSPSFGFNVEEMRYNCFVCGGGSLLKLVSDELEISKDDAVEWLKSHSSFEPSKSDDIQKKIMDIIHPVIIKEVIPEYPVDAVFQYQFIHPYLLDRGISREAIIEMNVGWDADHNGIIFPHWWNGKLVGWQVRHLSSIEVNSKDVFQCPVCLNPSKYNNTKGFPKKFTVYGLDKVKKKNWDSVIVVESPMSALYLMSHGYKNVVATFGSWNMEQLAPLSIFKRLLLWPDNDPAGFTNLMRVIEPLRQLTDIGIVPYVDKPHGDAADALPEEIQDYLDSALTPLALALHKGKLPTLAQLPNK